MRPDDPTLDRAQYEALRAEADARLAEAKAQNRAALVAVDSGRTHWGWHPVSGRVTVVARAPQAPESLPAYMAFVDDARHIHAGGPDPTRAMAALADLVLATHAQVLAAEEEA